jgi:hypothetical protein
MKKIMLVLVAMVMLSGCVNKVWMIPEGRTQMDFERDKAQCMYEARIYTPPSSAYVPPAPRDRYGISGAIATGLAQGIEEGVRIANLFGMCMRARGYYLVDKPQPIPVSDVSPQDIAPPLRHVESPPLETTRPEKPITSTPIIPSLGTTIILTWDFSVAYSGPGDNEPVIATFRKGDKLTILEQSGKWVKVRSENNQLGWIRSEVLE